MDTSQLGPIRQALRKAREGKVWEAAEAALDLVATATNERASLQGELARLRHDVEIAAGAHAALLERHEAAGAKRLADQLSAHQEREVAAQDRLEALRTEQTVLVRIVGELRQARADADGALTTAKQASAAELSVLKLEVTKTQASLDQLRNQLKSLREMIPG